MGLVRDLSGDVRVKLTSADTAGALASISGAGIAVCDVVMDSEIAVRFTLSRRDWRRAAAIADRRGDKLRVVGRQGIYWDLKRLGRRPVFAIGLAVLLLMALLVPSRVYIVEVQGNETMPANFILETAANCGISFGASRRAVRSEKVKNALLEAMPALGWAGVNTYGCRAVITVREKDPEPERPEENTVSSIVAGRDGYILSCDVVSGSGLCRPGQTVQAGEMLISGYTDCGICITAARAQGEVMAATRRSLTALTPAVSAEKGPQMGQTVNYSLIVGKNRIKFDKNSGISDASCGRMVTNYHLTLPGGYRLPVTLVKETVTSHDLAAASTQAEQLLKEFAARYLGSQMIAGTVTEAVEYVVEDGGVWILQGDYACTEMIGRERAEQNGELHETS